MPEADRAPRRRGRPPGAAGSSGTRQAILDAARARFATDGFAAATIRRIAADAGVDASLVMQQFGSKGDLFAAVMSIPPATLDRIAGAFDGPDAELGERLVRTWLGIWEGDAQVSEPFVAMLRGAITSEAAAAQLREFVQSRLVDVVGRRFPNDADATARASLASTMLIGVVVGRRVLGLPALVAEDTDALVRRLAPAIQSVLLPRAPRND